MIKLINGNQFKVPEKNLITSNTKVQDIVREIIEDVVSNGDEALIDYTEKFDGVKLSNIRVPKEEILNAGKRLKAKDQKVLETAIENIRRFHKKQMASTWKDCFDDGTELGQIVSPIDRAGIYIPGGRAVYPSSLIMNAVPAQIAKVPSIAVVSPPQKNGLPHEMILCTCHLLGLDEVYAIGGAHSIAALAYGTKSIEPVFKITGPGNMYVAEAKRQVFGTVGIDSIAGPSEILILHDDESIPVEYVVRDMLSQAEHDPEAQSILITTLEDFAQKVANRLNEIVPNLPRTEIISESLKNKGMIIVVEKLEQGAEIVNKIAPEHFELLVKDESILSKIRNFGAVFLGKWSSEPLGDYFAGPNHTLPTNGAAKYASPLGVWDFQKVSSYIRYTKQRLQKEGEMISRFAELEELYAHSEAIKTRLMKWKTC